MRTVVVTGASGVVGRSAAIAFEGAGWRVLALSRRDPRIAASGRGEIVHLSVDLSDADGCARALAAYPGVSHLAYAAVAEQPGLVSGWRDEALMQANLDMLRSVLDPLCAAGELRHVSILQGGKAYGAHIHPVPVPAREDERPRDPHANFYWLHEDAVRAAGDRYGLTWTVLRPPIIVGGAIGAAMNLALPIAAMAALSREEGRPCGFPGGVAKPFQMVDARVVADALLWAADAPEAANQIFNVDNGDLTDWRAMWPAMMEALGTEPGVDAPAPTGKWLMERADAWRAMAERDGLVEPDLARFLGESHHYADISFGFGRTEAPPPLFLSTIKIRREGFAGCMDSLETMLFWLSDLRARGYVR